MTAHGAPKAAHRSKTRLEAFSDGVLAIIITIMVLEMKVPHGTALGDLLPILPVFLSYVLSFVYIGIYWNNHHHLIHAAGAIDARIMWANLHLLFWLSIVPFATGWMGENHFAAMPTALYGVVLLFAGSAYNVLLLAILRNKPAGSPLRQAVGADIKGKLSIAFYAGGIALAWVEPWMSNAVYALVAVMWIVPDKRMERALDAEAEASDAV